MDGETWYVYIFQPSWDHYHYGLWGEDDYPGLINSFHHKDIFNNAEEISGSEKFLRNFKHFILQRLFNPIDS